MSAAKIEHFLGIVAGPARVLELYLVTSSGGTSFASSWELRPAPAPDELRVLAEEIHGWCLDDANGSASLQTYYLTYQGDQAPRSSQFRVAPNEKHALVSEPSNAQGLVGQAMRHTEALMRLVVQTHGTQIDYMTRLVSEKDEENRALRKDQVRNMRLVEELHSEAHARQLATRQAEADEERKKELLATGKALLPAVLGRLNGGSGATEALLQLIRSLDEDQRAQLASILTPAQLAALHALQEAAHVPASDPH